MAIVKFVLDTNELQFSRNISYPVEKPLEKIQVMDRAADGSLQREDLGVDIRTRRLVFNRMGQADYDALMTWFDSIANGIENEFTYHDENGDSMQVVFAQTEINFPEKPRAQFSGELLLEVVG